MAFLKKFLPLLLVSALSPIAVESYVDQPLDLKQQWNFLRSENLYLQHQCNAGRAEALAKQIEALPAKYAPLLGTRELNLPLQIRLLASAQAYRRLLHFSEDRDGHFNPRLNMIVTYCAAPAKIFEEQFLLFFLGESGLRPWQRVFIAETAAAALRGVLPAATATTTKKPAPNLLAVLLSNHSPAKAERTTLGHLALFLHRQGKLAGFITALTRLTENDDDTALDLLDSLFPGIAHELIRTGNIPQNGTNNTLRNYGK